VSILIIKFLAVIIIGYLVGSIPFGVLIVRRFAKVDVRQYGSGKIGMTNVLRVAGKKAAAMVGLLDIVKGALAVVAAWLLFSGQYWVVYGSLTWWLVRSAPAAAALAAMVGHIWPIFLKFHGGRGVATFFGGLVALSPAAALFGGEIVVIAAGLTRFASIGSLAGSVAAYTILVPLTLFNGFPVEYLLYASIGAVIIILKHWDNIIRLVRGKERKLGEKAEKIASNST